MDPNDLENRFTYHPPHERQAARYYLLRTEVHKLARLIDTKCPDSREKSLAITHLEETVMWANAAIARHDEEAARTAKLSAHSGPSSPPANGSEPAETTNS